MGVFADDWAVLGNTRLSIIDLADGHQPIINETGDLVIVFNGEIYNHRELQRDLTAKGHVFKTHSDTEAILHAFEEWGPDCLLRLNGMFAVAIWHCPSRRMFIARDRLGIKPLYLGRGIHGIAFASEPKALFPIMPDRPAPHWPSLARFLQLGYFAPGDCAFAGIEKFPAGHFGWIEKGHLSLHRWWTPLVGQGDPVPLAEAVAKAAELLGDAVESELLADVPVGVFLSGGLDSSAVAAAAAERGRKLPAFALSFPEATHDESADARLVADSLGLDYFEHRLEVDELRATVSEVATMLDEPFGDATVVPLLALSRFARRHVKVVLTGWGGDELFAGYPTLRAHRAARLYRMLPGWLGDGLLPAAIRRLPVSERYLSLEFKAKRFIQGMDLTPEQQHLGWMGYFNATGVAALLRPEIAEAASHDGHRALAVPDLARPTETDPVDRILHLDMCTFLEGNGLFQADRMTMAASLEARVPLLNTVVMDYVAALPAGVKMAGGQLKPLLKMALKPKLPSRIITKPKKGFGPPSAGWLRSALSDTLRTTLSREKIEADGILAAEATERLVDDHLNRRADHGRALWALLSFQLWHDNFISGAVQG
ncbi:hypothetical protein A6A04_04065 [Paramagnetospirillum marisnigri]|uniref:asparagine synthase (glutamine-hydrolyzing) n=2 Tax=Paramagnetospirillum marisnigri TaxID=1285242 RepID=A0A178ML19_9PROT|nr:hypothetical protein A6A04_04065 [Paramagnetospirillum marisnigri]